MRVNCYIDGFNLYHGLRRNGRGHLWLDLHGLASSYVEPLDTLGEVHYFTAPIRRDPIGLSRQNTYLAALRASGVRVHLGTFIDKTRTCGSCQTKTRTYEEKRTDVALGCRLLEHAALDQYDKAILITADSDMVPAVEAVRRVQPSSEFLLVLPPGRDSAHLRRAVGAFVKMSDATVRQMQLPPTVFTPDGRPLVRPPHWS